MIRCSILKHVSLLSRCPNNGYVIWLRLFSKCQRISNLHKFVHFYYISNRLGASTLRFLSQYPLNRRAIYFFCDRPNGRSIATLPPFSHSASKYKGPPSMDCRGRGIAHVNSIGDTRGRCSHKNNKIVVRILKERNVGKKGEKSQTRRPN